MLSGTLRRRTAARGPPGTRQPPQPLMQCAKQDDQHQHCQLRTLARRRRYPHLHTRADPAFLDTIWRAQQRRRRAKPRGRVLDSQDSEAGPSGKVTLGGAVEEGGDDARGASKEGLRSVVPDRQAVVPYSHCTAPAVHPVSPCSHYPKATPRDLRPDAPLCPSVSQSESPDGWKLLCCPPSRPTRTWVGHTRSQA